MTAALLTFDKLWCRSTSDYCDFQLWQLFMCSSACGLLVGYSFKAGSGRYAIIVCRIVV